jgi:hypothetical protein
VILNKKLMNAFLVAAIFIASTFFGAQSFSCDDSAKSVSATEQVSDTHNTSHSDHSDHENEGCDCPGHNHSCCNQPIPIFDSVNYSSLKKQSEIHSREPPNLLPSPILDGPYQPPKA